jgi:two-component system response regulator AtoC
MKGASILIADDDTAARTYLARFVTSCGYMPTCVASGDEVIARLKEQPAPNLVLLDMVMPGATGLEVLAYMKKVNSNVPVVALSGVGQVKTVVEAMRLGAADYISKPFEEQELQATLKIMLDPVVSRTDDKAPRSKQPADDGQELGVSSNAKMVHARAIARQVANTDVPVLILGESGVGKEVLARYIHAHSGRAGQPFIKVNCAALPNELLESELFGYEKGAFTGAVSDRRGKFELAGHGTILLDEIGEMSPALQAKLLHVLQDSEYNRLGGERLVQVHARVLASTNRRLEQMVSQTTFREDLYFRLNVISIEIPPLRERREDIPFFSSRFVAKYRDKYKSTVQALPEELVESFMRLDWPGNVRQLENTVKRYLILPNDEITPSETLIPTAPENRVVTPQPLFLKEVGAHAAERAERELVLKTLEQTRWNRKEAARLLNVSYKALRNKLKKWNLRGSASGAAAAGQPTQ